MLVYLVIPGTKTFLPCWARLVYTRRAGVGGAVFRLGTLRAAVNGVSRIGAKAHWQILGKCTVLSLLAIRRTENSRFAVTRSGRAHFPQPFPAAPYPVELAFVSVNAPVRVSAGLCCRWYNFKGVSACGSLRAFCCAWRTRKAAA